MPKPKRAAPPTDRIVRRPPAERKRLPPDLEAFARGDERALDRRPDRTDRVDDPRPGFLIAGVANRHARAVHDARVARMRAFIADGEAGRQALGAALAEAIRLGLWRGRSIVDFDAMAENELGLDAKEARAWAEESAKETGIPLEPLSERLAAIWFRVEAAGLEEDPSVRISIHGARAVVDIDVSRLAPTVAAMGRNVFPLAKQGPAQGFRDATEISDAGRAESSATEDEQAPKLRERSSARDTSFRPERSQDGSSPPRRGSWARTSGPRDERKGSDARGPRAALGWQDRTRDDRPSGFRKGKPQEDRFSRGEPSTDRRPRARTEDRRPQGGRPDSSSRFQRTERGEGDAPRRQGGSRGVGRFPGPGDFREGDRRPQGRSEDRRDRGRTPERPSWEERDSRQTSRGGGKFSRDRAAEPRREAPRSWGPPKDRSDRPERGAPRKKFRR